MHRGHPIFSCSRLWRGPISSNAPTTKPYALSTGGTSSETVASYFLLGGRQHTPPRSTLARITRRGTDHGELPGKLTADTSQPLGAGGIGPDRLPKRSEGCAMGAREG